MIAWFTYLVRCRDGSLYCGITKDITNRIAAHNAGTGAKYTRSRRPVTLSWKRRCRDESAARRLEAAVKRLAKEEKEAMTADFRR
jgi:putative endonuclease